MGYHRSFLSVAPLEGIIVATAKDTSFAGRRCTIASSYPFQILKASNQLTISSDLRFPSVMLWLLSINAIIINNTMAPRLLYCGKLESAEKLKDDAEKLAHYHVTNLINWSRRQSLNFTLAFKCCRQRTTTLKHHPPS